MTDIILSNENIFTKGGRKIKVRTSGINLTERFLDNPVMLFGHDDSKVIGKWDNVRIEGSNLIAFPNFDENDPEAEVIKNKYNKGYIKNASVGLTAIEGEMEDDVLVVTSSILYEASLVAVPANKAAKKLEFMLDLKLSNEDSLDEILKLKEVIEDNVEEVPAEIELSAEVKLQMEIEKLLVEKDSYTNKAHQLQLELREKDDTILSLQAELDASNVKNKEIYENSISLELKNTELTDTNVGLQADNVNLKAEKDSLILSNDTLNKEILSLKDTVAKLENSRKEDLLLSAVKDGKLTNEAVGEFMEFTYDKLESLLRKISPSTMSLSEVLTKKQSSRKTYEWYLKNDKGTLLTMPKENPSLYKQLEDEYKLSLKNK